MIPFLDLQKINLAHQQEIEQKLLQTFRFGWYVLVNEVKMLEETLSIYIGANATIIAGDTIGESVLIDVVSVIAKDLPTNTV
ncbi:MAG TPA: hypothetical protein PLJ42_00665 [Chitinophagales bacterium]|jgi:UDP-3-O-[3-hydroxymyristoyl] glucosamine N-acyltransferase|nr:hypothetical protein [Chitinophagales bacterium]HQW77912.1 hypothetical protein [Chitinophagales bacterium]HRB67621.1 hypothetical protein [Chitinophagales bacterium]